MRSIAILDAGPLYAATDRSEPDHRRCADILRRRDLDLVIPVLARMWMPTIKETGVVHEAAAH